jgi:hypothetical protein
MSEPTLGIRLDSLERFVGTLSQEVTKLRERITDLENRPPQIEEHYYHNGEGGLA